MAYTETSINAKSVIVDGIIKFQLEIEITNQGDLPSAYAFVISILDTSDPKEDSFARVANINDFEEVAQDRTTAVNTHAETYRVKSWTFLFDNVDTAAAAKDVLKSRLDTLVKDWRTYQTRFEATSEVTEHPRTDTDAYNSAIDTYELLLGTQQVAEETLASSQTDYNSAVTAAATAATALTNAQTTYTECTTARAWFQALYTAMQQASGFYQDSVVFKAAAETFRLACTGDHPTEEAVFISAYNAFSGKQGEALLALNTANSNGLLFDALCATKQALITAAQTAKATADTTVATKHTAYADAQSVLTAAQSAADSALAAVRALNPNYDPTTAVPNRSVSTGS